MSEINVPRIRKFIWPVWGHKPQMVFSDKALTSTIAMWVIKQSPYLFPENLEEAIDSIREQFLKESPDNKVEVIADDEYYFKYNIEELRVFLEKLFESNKYFIKYNQPKIVTGALMQGSASRYHKTKPDYDFIDLSALARNIAYAIGLDYFYHESEDCYNKLLKDFEKDQSS
jgi:hypothetical protein